MCATHSPTDIPVLQWPSRAGFGYVGSDQFARIPRNMKVFRTCVVGRVCVCARVSVCLCMWCCRVIVHSMRMALRRRIYIYIYMSRDCVCTLTHTRAGTFSKSPHQLPVFRAFESDKYKLTRVHSTFVRNTNSPRNWVTTANRINRVIRLYQNTHTLAHGWFWWPGVTDKYAYCVCAKWITNQAKTNH